MKRKLTQDFMVNDAPMLMPDAGVRIDSEDMESHAANDESGYMHRSLRRNDVKTWQFSYAILTAEEYAYIKSLVSGKANFQFTFKDETGAKKTTKAYCKQTSVSWWSAKRGLYKNLQFSIIEC